MPKKWPIPRKGTKYVVRASSHVNDSVPVVIAIRDMLKLAKNLREVKYMIQSRLLKINGREVKNYKESIKLFNTLQADKNYYLSILPTGKFALEESKDKEKRICKVTGKRLVKKGVIQLNFHDGSNIIAKDKININDSVYLNLSGKIVSLIKMERGKKAFVMSGKYIGQAGEISGSENGNVKIKFKDKEASLPKRYVIAL